MMPLISIVIPTYNRPQLIKQRALKSAIAQTYTNKQIIVVDDGSDMKYDISLPAYYYKPWEKNRGGSAARNYGVSQAKGQYIVFIDDDNELDPQFIEKTLPLFDDMWISAVTTGRYIKSELSGESKAMPTQTKFPAVDWGWLIKRDVFNQVKYDETIWGDEDADFGIHFARYFTYKVLPVYLQTAYAPSAAEEVTSNTFPNKRRITGLRNFLDKNLQYYDDPNERRYILRLAGRNFLRAKKYFEAWAFFWRSFMARKNWPTFKHFLFALGGWKVYDMYMSYTERRQL